MTTDKKTRTPRNSETITKGALALTLAEQVELCKALKANIDQHVKGLQEQAQQASALSSQLAGTHTR